MSVVKKDKEKEFMGGHTEPLSYADWLKSQGGISYTNDITQTDSAKYAEELLKRAQQGAQSAYDKSVTDANTRYKFNTASYGSGAEQKIGSGVSNSGYAKYLTDRAYSTMVDEQIAAKSALSAANTEAQNAYNDAMESIKTGQKASFDTLLQRVNSGEFNDFGNVSMLGLNSNLSDDQMSTLYGAYIKSNENKATGVFNNALDAINSGAYSTFDQVISSVGSTNLTTQQRESLYNAYLGKKAEVSAASGDVLGYIENSVAGGHMTAEEGSRKAADALIYSIQSGAFSIDEYKKYADANIMSNSADAERVRNAFAAYVKDAGEGLFYTTDAEGNPVKLGEGEATERLNSILASGLLTGDQMKSVRDAYDKTYTLPVQSHVIEVGKDFADGTGQALGIDPDVDFGDKQSTYLWHLNNSAVIYNKGEETNQDVLNAVKRANLYDGAAFRYNGQNYIYSKGKVYKFSTSSNLFENNIKSKNL
jgi:hypothetical protein